jgi:hypothetical protein
MPDFTMLPTAWFIIGTNRSCNLGFVRWRSLINLPTVEIG